MNNPLEAWRRLTEAEDLLSAWQSTHALTLGLRSQAALVELNAKTVEFLQ